MKQHRENRDVPITSRKEYEFYLEADRLSLEIPRRRPRLFGDEIWKFQRLLRTMEYTLNCRRSLLWRPYLSFLSIRFHRMSMRLGYTIPPNVFGPGLAIAHRGTIVVNSCARVGANCRLHVGVNIGTSAGTERVAPTIGDNVYIGPGAIIFGRIQIADGVAIGANSVVNRSFTDPFITIAGAPARKISDHGTEGLVIRGTEMAGQDRGG
ncbi:MAG TPA: serine acetyltransferase [Methanoregulaceae archaeon]|nr:serine acetyltransferase [Methanoregulaceae archaeon]HOV67215.1 serine acetyltransferase [Methanoregulaceae archaeon]HQJ88124.1 serine acetyltransferase [Methanoregulaceae archaeon]